MKDLTPAEIARLADVDIFDKVDQGEWYQYAKEPKVQAIVKQSAQTVQRINDVAKTDLAEATHLLQEFLPNMAADADVYFPITSIEHPQRLTIGDATFINAGLQILSAGRVTIGAHCFIGPNCQLSHLITIHMIRSCGVRVGNMIRQSRLGMIAGLVVPLSCYQVLRLEIT